MIFRMLAVLAEFEKEQVGERTRMALAHKKANGEAYCGAPFGFDAIANSLNDKGIEGKRGGKWFPSTVRYLIQKQAA